jgi:Transmembrane secretion effector
MLQFIVPANLIRERTFLRYWCARVCMTSANQMLMVAVGWEMYDLTASAWDLGLVGLYQFLPALALTLPAGHIADKLNRRYIVAGMSVLLMLVALLLAIASAQHATTRFLLLAVSVVLGMVRAFQMPAQQSLMPQLVPRAVLQEATAFSSAGTQAAIIIGPALGGAIYIAGASEVYVACAVFFLASVFLILGLRYTPVVHPEEPTTWKSVFAGITFIWGHKVVLGAVTLDLFAMLLGGATALLPMYAKDILFVGPLGLGLLRSAPAVGALAMSVYLARKPLTNRIGTILLASVAVYGVAMVVFGVSTSFLLSFIALAISGMADMVSVVIRMSLVALETPDAMRGRVSAVNSIFIGASNQLGEFESGATAAWLGPVTAVVIGGVGTVLVAASWLKVFPTLARRDRLS